MSLERRIRPLNNLLRSELGTDPLYGWQHTDSNELAYPMMVYVEDPSSPNQVRQIFDYYCGCGKNVRIHKPTCKSLSVPVPRVERRPLIDAPDCRNSWCLAACLLPDVDEWVNAYGTATSYPSQGQWMPVSSGTTTLMIPRHEVPTLEHTRHVIRMLKESRSISPAQWMEMWADQRRKREREHEQKQRDQIQDILSGSISPGRKWEKSYPTPEFLKNRGQPAPARSIVTAIP